MYAILDFETCGLDDDERVPVEIGCIVLDRQLNEVARFETLSDPERPCNPEAERVHGITRDMLEGQRSHADAMGDLAWFLHDNGVSVIVAQNAAFERDICQRYEGFELFNWFCTRDAARRCWPGLPKYKLGVLAVVMGLRSTLPAHRAMGDCEVTAQLFRLIKGGV